MALIDAYTVLGCGAPCEASFTKEQLLARMDALGITHSICVSSRAISSDFTAGNAWLAEQIAGERRLLGFAVVNTNHPEESIENMRRYLTKQQFVGLLVLQGNLRTPVNLEDSLDILNAYRRFAKTLLISAPNSDCVHAAAQIAAKFDQMRVAMVEMGGNDWRSAVAAAHQHLNMFLLTNGEVSPDKIRFGWRAVNGNRIIFASGAPSVDPAVMLGMVDELGLSEREKQQLTFTNSERTFAG